MVRSLPARPAVSLLGMVALAWPLAACGSRDAPAPASLRELRSGKPPSSPQLGEIKAQDNQLLDGGAEAFEARLADLRGHPIVVNQWASWRGPCRYAFPFFPRLAAEYGDRVAFLGVDSQDSRDDAEEFLAEFPTPYPHFFDPDGSGGSHLRRRQNVSDDGLLQPRGRADQDHLGAYAEQDRLEADIREMAIRG